MRIRKNVIKFENLFEFISRKIINRNYSSFEEIVRAITKNKKRDTCDLH